MEQHALDPAPVASRPTLARRATLDLLGLPPTPEEIDAFVAERCPDAWERFVDPLLSNPHYGERWGRHWLDVVRFAESYGFEHDLDNEHAYHYRDFVIHALNADLPFDQFVRWQIAGDELAPDQSLARMATGFLAAGVHNADIAAVRVEQERYDELDDMASTIGTAMLGLSIGCARCHDHKFDPIPQEEYYRFIASFERTVRGEIDLSVPTTGSHTRVLVAGEGVEPLARIYNPGPAFFETTWFLRRGDARQKDYEVTPGFLTAPSSATATDNRWRDRNPDDGGPSRRRSALARWLTDVDEGAGPLLARVIVNRLWQHHFGRGLVETPDDFGARGAPPSHPELLDHLAAELVHNGWSLKHVHRLIMTSAAYRQGVLAEARSARDDELVRGRKVRRLEAEAVRDSLLAVCGELNSRMYGPGTLVAGHRRRSIYFKVKRSQLIPMMTLFDAPEALQGTGKRPSTTIAPQALALINSPIVERFAHRFARRLMQSDPYRSEIGHDLESLGRIVQRAYRLALGRPPRDTERDSAMAFIQQQQSEYEDQTILPPKPDDESLVVWLDAASVAEQSEVANWRDWRGTSAPYVSLDTITAAAPKRREDAAPAQPATLRFGDGGPTVLRIPNDEVMNIGSGDFTITALLRIAPGSDVDQQILGKDSFDGTSDSYSGFFLQSRSGQLRFATRRVASGSGPANYLDARITIETGRWHRVSALRRDGTLLLFIDDASAPDRSHVERSRTNINSNATFKIGDMDAHPAGGFHGELAELLVYDRALSDAEIQRHHLYLRRKYLTNAHTPRESALADFCQALLCLNEFIYVE